MSRSLCNRRAWGHSCGCRDLKKRETVAVENREMRKDESACIFINFIDQCFYLSVAVTSSNFFSKKACLSSRSRGSASFRSSQFSRLNYFYIYAHLSPLPLEFVHSCLVKSDY